MNRYTKLFENRKNDFLDKAEDFLNNGNFHSAVRNVALGIGMSVVPHRYDKDLADQELGYLKKGNNANNFLILSNLQKILSGRAKQIIKIKDIAKPKPDTRAIDSAVQKAFDSKQAQVDADEAQVEAQEPMSDNDEEIEDAEGEEIEDVEEEIMERYNKHFDI